MSTINTDVPTATRKTTSAADVSPGKLDEQKLESAPLLGSGASAAEIKKGMSVIDIIKLEHATVKQLFIEYQAASAGEVKEAKGFMIMKLLVQHAAKEEAVLYPTIRAKLEDGNALADRAEAEHQKITEDLYELDKLTWAMVPAEFDRLVRVTMDDNNKHVVEEEAELLPKLTAKCTQQELVELGDRFQSQIVTTRPHPSAPREGVAAQLAQLASKPLDAARDAVRFDEKTMQAAASK